MTLSQIADFADLIAAFGVIASLLFLAFEIRKNSAQSRLANWNTVLTSLREHKRRTDDMTVADVVQRGRADYHALSPAEKVMFGYWMEEYIQVQEGLLIFRDASAHRREELTHAAMANFRYQFAHPGCRDWWADSGLSDRWPKSLVTAVETALAETQHR